jgi:GxxExxY protein
MMNLNRISSEIISAAVAVHKELGPGLLESVYQSCMIVELHQRGFCFESEVAFPVLYRGIKVNEEGFRLDLLVEKTVIVELKSVEKVMPVHQKQLLTYLRLTKKPLGLLINFNATKLVDGITRIVNTIQ